MAVKQKKLSTLGVDLGNNILERRLTLGWTQAELAERLGVDTTTISRFERGSNLPSLLRLEELANVLDIPLSALMGASSSHNHDQSQKVFGWVAELKEDDKEFVFRILKQLSAHLLPRR
ncbi:MAG: helix-turn-helix transcriptional regulator [Gallionellaceae bacterium]